MIDDLGNTFARFPSLLNEHMRCKHSYDFDFV